MTFLDASDPTDILFRRRVQREGAAGMARRGDALYVLYLDGALLTYDVSDPNRPAEVHALGGLGSPWKIELAGELAYVADNVDGLWVVDVSEPMAPALLRSVPTAGGAQDLSVGEGYLYVAAGLAGVETFSLADPAAPASLGTAPVGASAVAAHAAGETLWVTNQEGVIVASLADPARPSPRSSERTLEWSLGVYGTETRGFVAGYGNFEVYDYDPAALAPELDPLHDVLYFYQGDQTQTLRLDNRGGAPLEIDGAFTGDDRFALQLGADVVSPGGATTVEVTFTDDGEPIDARICVPTNDPDAPLLKVGLSDQNAGSSIAVGEPAIPFALHDIEGVERDLLDVLGAPILIVFWGTW